MGFINEIRTHRYRTWKSICTSLLFTGLGLHSAAFGPSLIDLMLQVGTTIDKITHILPTRAFGNMVGSTVCGFILACFDLQVVLIINMLIMSLSMFFIPFCSQLWQLYVVMIINGFGAGLLVKAGNCFVIHLWGKENSPFMQMAHFCFGLGGFVSPFIVEPFLREVSGLDLIEGVSLSISNATELEVQEKPIVVDPNGLTLKWAYFIIGGLSMFFWILFVITFLKKRDNKPHPTRLVKEEQVKENETFEKLEMIVADGSKVEQMTDEKPAILRNINRKIRPYHKYVIVAFAALFIHFAYGLELSFGVMLASYGRLSDLHMSKTSASFVTSLYWGCFTFFRLCTLVLINFVSARTMIIIELSLIMISNIVLLPFLFVTSYSENALWIGSALMGIGVSSLYPTLWSFLEEILPVTSKMISIVNSCACVGEFIVPVVIGVYIESWPNVYIVVVFLYSFLATILFVLLVIWEYIINQYKRS